MKEDMAPIDAGTKASNRSRLSTKPEIRNPKSEGRPKSEIRKGGGLAADPLVLPALSFGLRISSFGFRISDLLFRSSDFISRFLEFIEPTEFQNRARYHQQRQDSARDGPLVQHDINRQCHEAKLPHDTDYNVDHIAL